MEFDLKDIGITFIVGAFTILGIEAIFYYFFRIRFTGFFHGRLGLGSSQTRKSTRQPELHTDVDKQQDRSEFQIMKVAVFVGIAFAIGLVTEDLSYKFVDNMPTPFKALPANIASLLPQELHRELSLPSKETSRVRVMVKSLGEPPTFEPLAVDLAQNGAFALTDTVDGPKMDEWIACQPDMEKLKKQENITEERKTQCQKAYANHPSSEQLKNSIVKVYYYAKNRAYAVPQYYDEMKKIESRRDFSRSIGLVAIAILFPALIVGLIAIVASIFRSRINGRRAPLFKKRLGELLSWFRDKTEHRRVTIERPTTGVLIRNVSVVCLILVLINFFSMWAYERESDEFNKRAFGYYSSALFFDKQMEKSKHGEQPVPTLPNTSTERITSPSANKPDQPQGERKP